MIDLTELSDDDLRAHHLAVATEIRRRETLAAYPERQAALYASARAADPTVTTPVDGAPFVQPTGYHDAYPLGTIVTHQGRRWQATQDGAWMEPAQGNSGWVLLPEDDLPPDPWVAPHAGEEYPEGAVVTHLGYTWRNDLGRPNPFEPGQAHSGWTLIE